jgi:hypothetical protein
MFSVCTEILKFIILLRQGILFLQRKRIIPKVEIVDKLKRKFTSYGTNSYVNEGSFKVTNDFGIILSRTTPLGEFTYCSKVIGTGS